MTSFLRRMRVATRFAIAFALIVAIALTSGAVSWVSAEKQEHALQKTQELARVIDYSRRQDFWNADVSGWQAAYAWDTYRIGVSAALDPTSGNRAGYLRDRRLLLAVLAEAPTDLMTPGERYLNQGIVDRWNRFFALDDLAVAAYRAGDFARAEHIIIVQAWAIYEEILTVTKQLDESVTARAGQTQAAARQASSRARRCVVVFSLSAILLTVMLLLALVRTVVVPLQNLTKDARALANDHLPAAIDVFRSWSTGDGEPALRTFANGARDEIGGLAEAFDHLQKTVLDLAREQYHAASHDALTQLPNRAHALELIELSLQRASRRGLRVGVLFVDLDYFKAVNDTFGHAAGDELLRVVAARMRAASRASDVVCRLGGDEFIVLVDEVDSVGGLEDFGHRLVEAVSAPVPLEVAGVAREARVGASIGVALSHPGTTGAACLVEEADIAVYEAKAAGRGAVRFSRREPGALAGT